MAESEEELKSLLMKVKEESEKAGLKLNIQKWRSWHLVPSLNGKQMGKQWKQWQTDGDCSHEIKRHLLLGRKALKNLDNILKSRDITLPTKIYLIKAMVFLVVMYRCESWTIKKAECQRIDAFKLWCWRRLLRVPWTARRSDQSIRKEILRECSSEGLMVKLKLQYFDHLMQRADSLEKTLILGKIEGRRRRGKQRVKWLDGITDSMDMNASSGRWWQTAKPGVLQSVGLQRVGHDWVTDNWFVRALI